MDIKLYKIKTNYYYIIYNKMKIIVNTKYAYFNATYLCKITKSNFKNWFDLDKTTESIKYYDNLFLPKKSLYFIDHGLDKVSGIYLYIDLFILLALWISDNCCYNCLIMVTEYDKKKNNFIFDYKFISNNTLKIINRIINKNIYFINNTKHINNNTEHSNVLFCRLNCNNFEYGIYKTKPDTIKIQKNRIIEEYPDSIILLELNKVPFAQQLLRKIKSNIYIKYNDCETHYNKYKNINEIDILLLIEKTYINHYL